MNLISIIVPCFNQANYLSEALASIEKQTHSNWECIIVNDGSTDQTNEVAELFVKNDKRFKYISQQNGGLSNARNNGIKEAMGDFIQLLDADDLLEKNALKSKLLFKSKNIINYSSMRYFEDNDATHLKILGRGQFIAHVELHDSDAIDSQKEVIELRNPCVISAPLYPKDVFKNVGCFDESLTALEDWDLHIRCINNNYKFHHQYAESSKTLIRLHNNSMMRNQQLMDINFMLLIEKHNLREPVIAKQKRIRDYIRGFIPPIILDLKRKLF